MPFEPGTVVGRYEIESLIAVGGMGEVYRARDPELHRSVALKFLSQEFSSKPDRLNRFIQEARAASALNHPNIVTVHEIGRLEDRDNLPFMATELIDGVTLREYARKPIKLREMLDIAIQIASALVAAHEAGIVHRDIKPDNIMVRRDGSLICRVMFPVPNSSPDAFTLTAKYSCWRVCYLFWPSAQSLLVYIVGAIVPQLRPEQSRSLDSQTTAIQVSA